MRDEILKMLEDADGYVSGQELCEKLGVSRTAVWKVIGALREEGYVIDSVSRRGYHLVECPDILRQEDLTAALTTRWMGRSLQVYDVTDSTNVRAKQQAEEGAPEGHLVMADMQSAGRGSRGRSWDSPRGTGIFMSLVLRPQLMPQQAAMVTLTAAYSIVSVLREDYGVAAGIKWPNDVVLNRKKLVGILTEMSAEPDLIHYIVTGIGITGCGGITIGSYSLSGLFIATVLGILANLILPRELESKSGEQSADSVENGQPDSKENAETVDAVEGEEAAAAQSEEQTTPAES